MESMQSCDILVANERYYLYIHSPTNGDSSNHYQITIVKHQMTTI
jgi:hypothetical protein